MYDEVVDGTGFRRKGCVRMCDAIDSVSAAVLFARKCWSNDLRLVLLGGTVAAIAAALAAGIAELVAIGVVESCMWAKARGGSGV